MEDIKERLFLELLEECGFDDTLNHIVLAKGIRAESKIYSQID